MKSRHVSMLAYSVLVSCPLGGAEAHDAPGGWACDVDCCSPHDRWQSKAKDVSATPDGWLINATHQLIGYDGSNSRGIKLRRSKDEFFHRCSIGSDPVKRTIASTCRALRNELVPFGTSRL